MGEGDTGPNTGGMGTYSPAPVLTPAIEAAVMRDLVVPTARGMCAEGTPFRGVLFAGLMIENGQVGRGGGGGDRKGGGLLIENGHLGGEGGGQVGRGAGLRQVTACSP